MEKTSVKPQGNPRLSVLNHDDGSYAYLSQLVPGPQISYGLHPPADVQADAVKYSPNGIHFLAKGPRFRVPVTSPLVGEFNVSNCLAALTVAVSGLGISAEIAALGIAAESKSKVGKFTPPPARPPGKIICADDTPEGKAAELAKLLREEAKVI